MLPGHGKKCSTQLTASSSEKKLAKKVQNESFLPRQRDGQGDSCISLAWFKFCCWRAEFSEVHPCIIGAVSSGWARKVAVSSLHRKFE